jgi:hypothetical protein
VDDAPALAVGAMVIGLLGKNADAALDAIERALIIQSLFGGRALLRSPVVRLERQLGPRSGVCSPCIAIEPV